MNDTHNIYNSFFRVIFCIDIGRDSSSELRYNVYKSFIILPVSFINKSLHVTEVARVFEFCNILYGKWNFMQECFNVLDMYLQNNEQLIKFTSHNA